MKILKKSAALLIAAVLLFTSFAVSAEETEQTESIKILFLGNSLIYFNDMDTEIFPQMCQTGGKSVEVSSITESGTTIYRLASDKTSIGKEVLQTLENNVYDYVVIQPSRRVTPFEYSVYHAEKAAALKLNEIINNSGAKTVLLAEPGLNTGMIPVYTMSDDGINSSTEYELPMDRNTHSRYVENLCNDFCKSMVNAQVVSVGAAVETLLKHYPDYNSLYREDNRHPSSRGSYLQALCIYSALFNESFVGKNYISSLYPENAIIAQRAAATAILGEPEENLISEQCKRIVKATLTSNSSALLQWKEPKEAVFYEIYRKLKGENYSLIGRTIGNETSFADTTLQSGSEYYYRIKAVHKVGEIEFRSEYSDYSIVETLSRPLKPSAVLINKKTSKITLKSVKNAEKYRVFRKKEGEINYKFIGETTKLEYIDNTMRAGNTYIYSVVAEMQDGVVQSDYSVGRKIVALASPKATLSSVKKRRVTIDIKPVKSADKYMIYIKKQGENKYKLIKTTSKLKVTVRKLESGQRYYFRLKAYKEKDTKTTSSVFRIYKIKVK